MEIEDTGWHLSKDGHSCTNCAEPFKRGSLEMRLPTGPGVAGPDGVKRYCFPCVVLLGKFKKEYGEEKRTG